MADEENPFGGGPFGVGPFGPLVGAVTIAATAFSFAATTTVAPLQRTLYYQANIAPPVAVVQQAEEFLPRPDKWMPRWQGPPKYQPNKGPFAASRPDAPPPVIDNINAATGIITGGIRTKTLFYQSKIYGLAPPVEVVVDVTIDKWQVPLSRAAPRLLAKTALYTPFVPREAVLENTQTPDKWLQRWNAPVPHAWPIKQLAPFVPREAVLDNTVTPDKWLPAWRSPPNYNPAPQGGLPFVPKEAVAENTQTPDKWLQRWHGAVPIPPVHHTQPVFGYPYEAASNLTTTLEWMAAWPGTKRPLLPLAGGVVNVPLPSNLTTTLEWQIAWRGPPRSTPAPQGGQPFVPKEAVLENTVTPEKWAFRFQAAVPIPPVHHTQPVLGYPYAAASNLTTTLEWMPAWQGPPRFWPIKVQALPFVPKADVVDVVTPDKWLIKWQGPPNYNPAPAGGSPFIPKEAVLENTVTPDKWLVRFAKAVPVPKPVPSQPAFGYPYEAASNLTTTIEWLRAWPVPPRYQPAKIAAQPFVPREAVLENTVTPDKWLFRWQGAVPGRKPIHTQPFYGYPYVAAATLTTTLEWLPSWRGPPQYQPAKIAAQPFVPRAAVLENTVTPDKWLQRWQGPPRYWPLKVQAPPFVPKETVRDTVTPDKWLKPLGVAAKRPPAWQTQPLYVFPPEPFVTPDIGSSTTWTFLGHKALFYQAWTVRPYGEVPAPNAVEGGPADETERIVCVPTSSRTAVEPDLLRTATIPLQDRVATVPEVLRVAEVPEQSRTVNSNEYRDRPCHDT